MFTHGSLGGAADVPVGRPQVWRPLERRTKYVTMMAAAATTSTTTSQMFAPVSSAADVGWVVVTATVVTGELDSPVDDGTSWLGVRLAVFVLVTVEVLVCVSVAVLVFVRVDVAVLGVSVPVGEGADDSDRVGRGVSDAVGNVTDGVERLGKDGAADTADEMAELRLPEPHDASAAGPRMRTSTGQVRRGRRIAPPSARRSIGAERPGPLEGWLDERLAVPS
jgi:hypothetical protein